VGDTWDADPSRALLDELWATLIADHSADPTLVAVHGDSMGGFTGLGWASENIGSLACATGIAAMVDGDTAYAGFSGDFDAAYGSEAAWLAAKPTHDPTELATAGVFDGIPTKLWGGTLDTVTPVADMDAFVALVGPTASVVEIATDHFGMFGFTLPYQVASFIVGSYPATAQARAMLAL
jgi:hypothetical protein